MKDKKIKVIRNPMFEKSRNVNPKYVKYNKQDLIDKKINIQLIEPFRDALLQTIENRIQNADKLSLFTNTIRNLDQPSEETHFNIDHLVNMFTLTVTYMIENDSRKAEYIQTYMLILLYMIEQGTDFTLMDSNGILECVTRKDDTHLRQQYEIYRKRGSMNFLNNLNKAQVTADYLRAILRGDL
jgi:hypothetical protein